MEPLSTILLYFCFISAAIVILMAIGDLVARKKFIPKFTRWWRQHIVDEYPYNDDKF